MQYLNAAGKAVMASNQFDCIGDAAARYPFLKVSTYAAYPGAIDAPAVTKLLRSISPLWFGDPPTAPIYDYHSVLDELAPIGPDRQLVKRYCAAGVRVEHVESIVGEHIAETATGAPGALAYLAARFAGQPPPDNCS
jgi:hypothetical protein